MNFFEAQDRARRSTRWLIIAYLVATVFIVLGVTLIVAAAFHLVGDVRAPVHPSVLAATAILTALLIAGATLYKTAALSAGGGRVATDMGGTLVLPDIKDPLRRRLRNIVEEMAIASGVLAPEVYVLESEPGINAFAAGLAPGDAAIAVTRGALETLDRDELQGVIAHEFSHILNGDMRLNVRMIGVLFGIMVLSIIGRLILRGSYHGRAISMRRNRGAPFVLMIGAGLATLGWIGVFLARLIKAGVSRQREMLADASAVQFTRQTEGLANALKKIGGYAEHSWFRAADPEEVSHMLFARGSRRFASLFATHPPLESRIRALDPSFREGDYPRVLARTSPLADEAQGSQAAAFAATAGLQGDAVADTIARPGPAHIERATRLRRSIPVPLHDAAHSHEDAWLLTVALALHPEEQQRERQLSVTAEQLGRDRTMRVRRFDEALRALGAAYYLPLLDIAFPALRRRPRAQLEFLLALIRRLVELDHRIELREYCFMKILAGNLGIDKPSGSARPTRMTRDDARQAALALLHLTVRQGASDDGARSAAFRAGLQALGMETTDARPAGDASSGIAELDRQLDLLRRLNSADKNRLVQALAAATLSDAVVAPREAELLRAVCASLDCPLPPLEPAGPAVD